MSMRAALTLSFTLTLTLTLALPGYALSAEEARHLLARTGAGPTRAEIEALLPLSRADAVQRVVSSARTTPLTPAPEVDGVPEMVRKVKAKGGPKDEAAQQMFKEERMAEAINLKVWWANEMLTTTSPFTEHMVLFWSNHFTSSLQKVKVPALLWQQHLTIRRHATGDFRAFLHAIADDPAMLVYLDGAKNKAGAANENFARELLELFTLGVGHYSERDVKEAARAFTGTTVSRRTGETTERRFLHDDGDKTFLGVTGDLDGDDIIEIVLQQPRTAELIVEKLWRDLISPTPDARAVKSLAAQFRADWRIDRLLVRMLASDAFWAKEHRGALVKSPVELVVGASRALEVPVTPEWVAFTTRSLGQDLFDPPNVKGWPGGTRWITTLTLPDRERLALEAAAASKLDDSRTSAVSLSTLLLPLPPASLKPSVGDIARDPAFQLK